MHYILTTVNILDDYTEGPSHVVIPITRGLKKEILACKDTLEELSKKVDGLYTIEFFYYGATYGDPNRYTDQDIQIRTRLPRMKEKSVEAPTIRVGKSGFSAVASLPYCNVYVEGEEIPFSWLDPQLTTE